MMFIALMIPVFLLERFIKVKEYSIDDILKESALWVLTIIIYFIIKYFDDDDFKRKLKNKLNKLKEKLLPVGLRPKLAYNN